MNEIDSSVQNPLIRFLKQNLLLALLFGTGIVLLVFGLIQFLGKNDNEIRFEKGQSVEAASTSADTAKIYVDVSGEVNEPGVYEFGQNSRVQDAINKAGGLSKNADQEYVSKSVNLASSLSDGMKIYIPKTGEAGVVVNSGGFTQTNNGGLVSVNRGSQSELEGLPGIGPVTAGKIISSRPYSSIEELISKKVVSSSVYTKIKDLISL